MPRLRMGLVGFGNDEFLTSVLRTRVTVPWERSAAIEADALWVNGARSQAMDNRMVSVFSADAAQKPTILHLNALVKPIWFSLPLADPALRVPAVFDPRDATSIDQALRAAEKILLPLAVQLAVAGKLVHAANRLAAPAYELRNGDELLAVVNVAKWVLLHPRLRPHDIDEAECVPRAVRPQVGPPHFVRIGFAEMMWVYVKRTRIELLPARYLARPILFRAVPKIRRNLLGDTDLLVLSELMAAHQTLAMLQERTGLGTEAIVRALTALYVAGSITTDPTKAAPIQGLLRKRRDAAPGAEAPEFGSLPSGEPGAAPTTRPTVPVTLQALRHSTKK